jgi:hypothetical protein
VTWRFGLAAHPIDEASAEDCLALMLQSNQAVN